MAPVLVAHDRKPDSTQCLSTMLCGGRAWLKVRDVRPSLDRAGDAIDIDQIVRNCEEELIRGWPEATHRGGWPGSDWHAGEDTSGRHHRHPAALARSCRSSSQLESNDFPFRCFGGLSPCASRSPGSLAAALYWSVLASLCALRRAVPTRRRSLAVLSLFARPT